MYLYVTLHKETKHNMLDVNDFLALIEESFLSINLWFVASRLLYLPSYGSKKSGKLAT